MSPNVCNKCCQSVSYIELGPEPRVPASLGPSSFSLPASACLLLPLQGPCFLPS